MQLSRDFQKQVQPIDINLCAYGSFRLALLVYGMKDRRRHRLTLQTFPWRVNVTLNLFDHFHMCRIRIVAQTREAV